MNKKITHFLVACALLLSTAVNSQIINGTFDENNPGYGFYCGAPYGWTSSNNTSYDIQWEIEWNDDGDTWWVDLTGCGWGNGNWLEQSVLTVPGDIYTLTFDLGCWNGQYYTDAGANVYIDGALIGHYSHDDLNGHSLAWETFSFCFLANGSTTTIRFEGDGAATPATPPGLNPISNYVGVIGLDNVKLEKADAQIFVDNYCVPQTLTHNGGGGNAYWYLNGNYVGQGDEFEATVPGTYRLYYKTACGAVEHEVELIDCDNPCELEADFTIESINWQTPEIYCAGQYVIFTAPPTPGASVQYSWNFGNGPTDWTTNTIRYHIFQTPGIYNICLTVWYTPDKYPICDPVTICKTIVVIDCDVEGFQPKGGTQPDQPGGDKSTMPMPYPMLEVFPNPATELVTITGLTEIDAQAHVSLYTIAGDLVYEETVAADQHETTFSLKELKAGVYILKVRGREFTQEVKLVKE